MNLLDMVMEARRPKREERKPGGLLGDRTLETLTGGRTGGDLLQRGAMASAPIPIVGDLLGLANDVNVYRTQPEQRTLLNYGLSAAGLLPFVPGTFAGVGAKTANKAALQQAQTMTKAGADPTEVWKTTGWTDQFPDGKWRFEISDHESKLRKQMLDDVERGAKYRGKNPVTEADLRAMRGINEMWWAQDAMSHPDLWKAYPDNIAYYPIAIDDSIGGKGAFSDVSKSIALAPAPEKQMHSTALHELQHAIQQREGFARGGNTASATSAAETKEIVKRLEDQMMAARDARDKKKFKELYDAINDIEHKSGIGAYRRLAGEAEARLTQARMALTPAERAARPPWLEFDVPREQQIVRSLLDSGVSP